MQIDILNPKATKLLQDLADLDLIAIKQNNMPDAFQNAIERLRNNVVGNPPTLHEITEEVESVREERYARSKR